MEAINFPVRRLTVRLKDGWLPAPSQLQVFDIKPSELLGYKYLEIHPRKRNQSSSSGLDDKINKTGKDLKRLFRGDYILIPEPHLSFIGLKSDSEVTIVGLESYFGIWNPDYLAQVSKLLPDELYKLGV